jgi:agmatinase
VLAALDYGAIPAVLGGEHTISAPTARALKMRHGRFGVVHFDAHADLRDTYEGTPFSHACVMRRVHELGIPLYQIGTRGYCLEEHRYRIEQRIPYVDARELHAKGCEAVRLLDDFPEKIFISFDLDAFDSSFMPATGTPVPGGLFWHQVRTCLERVMQGRRCIGFDVVELAPMPGLSAPNFAAAQLVYDIMGLADRSGATGR